MTTWRSTRVVIDPDAITRNVDRLVRYLRTSSGPDARSGVAPAGVAPSGGPELCAVVKANGYGHDAVVTAKAARAGGATWLAVALVEEAVQLRDAAVDCPILLLSEPPIDAWAEVAQRRLDAIVYSTEGIEAAAAAARAAGVELNVHLKVDTGMRRVGCEVSDAADLAERIVGHPELALRGLCTHFAMADEPHSMFTSVQLERFHEAERQILARGITGFLRHAANSAAAVLVPKARFDLVRVGIAIYGVSPSPSVDARVLLEPALRLESTVSFVKTVEPGEAISYGCRFTTDSAATIATVPVGYADGIDRHFGIDGGSVLIGGRRHPVVGTVTMDQIMVEVSGIECRRGDEVVLIGHQGAEEITANEVAAVLDTIGYEVVTRLGSRIGRTYLLSDPPPRTTVNSQGSSAQLSMLRPRTTS